MNVKLYGLKMKLSEIKILLAFVAAGCMLSGCSAVQYPSTMAEEIVVDGKQNDWSGSMTYFEDPGLMLGIKNDSEYLYICMSSGSSEISKQIIMGGLIFWIDPDGGSDKFKGIRFPLGMAGNKAGMREMKDMRQSGINGNPGSMERPGEMNGADRKKMLDMMAGRLKIIRSEPEEEFVLDISEVSGVEAMIGDDSGVFTIELKIPLQRSENNMFAAGVEPGGKLGLGLCTPEFERPSMSGSRGGGGGMRPGGGMGGMSGGRGGGGGMRPGGGMRAGSFSQPEEIDIWMEVSLAKN